MDISICIPVYNVETYLERCLNSLFSQNFNGSFEVICVDDSSADNSLSILESYQKKESRLKVFKLIDRKKISQVRAQALSFANGDYIMQVDADDWLKQDALNSIYQKCLETKADIVVYNYISENALNFFKNSSKSPKEGFFIGDKSNIQEIFNGASVCKVVKRKLIHNILFDTFEISWGDDFIFNIEMLLKAETIYLLPQAYYVYCINPKSITSSIKTKEKEMLHDRIASMEYTILIQERYFVSDNHKNAILNYHIYKYLILLFRITNKESCNFDQLMLSLKKLPLMTSSKYRRVYLSMKYPLYALIYLGIAFDLRTAVNILKKKLKEWILNLKI